MATICCGYSFELHQQVDAIQMGTYNICLIRKRTKSTLLKTTDSLFCALIGMCAVIRSNMVKLPVKKLRPKKKEKNIKHTHTQKQVCHFMKKI